MRKFKIDKCYMTVHDDLGIASLISDLFLIGEFYTRRKCIDRLQRVLNICPLVDVQGVPISPEISDLRTFGVVTKKMWITDVKGKKEQPIYKVLYTFIARNSPEHMEKLLGLT